MSAQDWTVGYNDVTLSTVSTTLPNATSTVLYPVTGGGLVGGSPVFIPAPEPIRIEVYPYVAEQHRQRYCPHCGQRRAGPCRDLNGERNRKAGQVVAAGGVVPYVRDTPGYCGVCGNCLEWAHCACGEPFTPNERFCRGCGGDNQGPLRRMELLDPPSEEERQERGTTGGDDTFRGTAQP